MKSYGAISLCLVLCTFAVPPGTSKSPASTSSASADPASQEWVAELQKQDAYVQVTLAPRIASLLNRFKASELPRLAVVLKDLEGQESPQYATLHDIFAAAATRPGREANASDIKTLIPELRLFIQLIYRDDRLPTWTGIESIAKCDKYLDELSHHHDFASRVGNVQRMAMQLAASTQNCNDVVLALMTNNCESTNAAETEECNQRKLASSQPADAKTAYLVLRSVWFRSCSAWGCSSQPNSKMSDLPPISFVIPEAKNLDKIKRPIWEYATFGTGGGGNQAAAYIIGSDNWLYRHESGTAYLPVLQFSTDKGPVLLPRGDQATGSPSIDTPDKERVNLRAGSALRAGDRDESGWLKLQVGTKDYSDWSVRIKVDYAWQVVEVEHAQPRPPNEDWSR